MAGATPLESEPADSRSCRTTASTLRNRGSVRKQPLLLMNLPESILRQIASCLDGVLRIRIPQYVEHSTASLQCPFSPFTLVTTHDSFSFVSSRARAIALSARPFASVHLPCRPSHYFLNRISIIPHTFRHVTSLAWWISPVRTDDLYFRQQICSHVTEPSVALVRQLHNFYHVRDVRISIRCSFLDDTAAPYIMFHIAAALAAAQMQPGCPPGLRDKDRLVAKYSVRADEQHAACVQFSSAMLVPLSMQFARRQSRSTKHCASGHCTFGEKSDLVKDALHIHSMLMQELSSAACLPLRTIQHLPDGQITVKLHRAVPFRAPMVTAGSSKDLYRPQRVENPGCLMLQLPTEVFALILRMVREDLSQQPRTFQDHADNQSSINSEGELEHPTDGIGVPPFKPWISYTASDRDASTISSLSMTCRAVRRLVDQLVPITAMAMHVVGFTRILVDRDRKAHVFLLGPPVLGSTYAFVRRLTLEIGTEQPSNEVRCAAIHAIQCGHSIVALLETLEILELRTLPMLAIDIEYAFSCNLEHIQLAFYNIRRFSPATSRLRSSEQFDVVLRGSFRAAQMLFSLLQVRCQIPESQITPSSDKAYAFDCCTEYCDGGCCKIVNSVADDFAPESVRSEVWSRVSEYIDAAYEANMEELEEQGDIGLNDWNGGKFTTSYILTATAPV